MGKRYFSNKFVEWYVDHSRPLPWRTTTDPYKIWLSEVILQQTRVAQGLPYYQRFVEAYPSVDDLAGAPEREVLRLWQGLGYYSRARNLHKCAKEVQRLHRGKFPADYSTLLSLPGIGEYTAAAIASFSAGERVAVVDGNVFRVLARLFGISTPINSTEGKKEFTRLANELMPEKTPGLHNQAIMEFGALLCKPRNPLCGECPVKRSCVAFQQAQVFQFPVKTPKRKPRQRHFLYLVVKNKNRLLMKRRNDKDIWHGLFDFILIETTKPAEAKAALKGTPYAGWINKKDPLIVSKTYKHILTHQVIHCRFVYIQPNGAIALEKGLVYYSAKQVAELPKPALITRFLSEQTAIS